VTKSLLGSQKAVEHLVGSVRRGECILFLGAGVHAPPPPDAPWVYPEETRLPMAGALAQELARDCEFETHLPNDSPWDLQRVSLCYENTRGLGRQALVDTLVRLLDEGKEPSPALRMLASLPFQILVTTNYDHLLERSLHELGKREQKLVYNPEHDEPSEDVTTDPTPERPLLFKIHGDLDRRESIVITDEDYITFVQRMAEKENSHPVPPTVRYRMMKWPILFVGFSLRDYNLRLLFRTLRWRVDPAKFPVCYSVDLKPDPLIVEVWEHQRRFVTFVPQNLWNFVPWLYKEVLGHDYGTAAPGDAA
jgi:hypothetical protein